MTTYSLPRRAVIGSVLAASLIGTGLVAAFADAPAGGCPAWTDPKGDSTTGQEPSGTATDANLDIVAATAATTADKVVVTITTDGMAAGASDAGDEFGLDLTIGDADLFIAADRQVEDTTTAHVGNYADPTVFEDATATFDVKAKTVTITAPVASLKAAAGADVLGKPATALSAYTANAIPFAEFGFLLYDTADTKATLTMGTDCAGGAAAPAPAPSASPSASPSPSAAPAPPTGGAPAAAGAPRADCFTAKDPKGDAKYSGQSPNDPDMDILGLTLGTTADALVGYFKVDKLAEGPSSLNGHRFAVNFTFNKHTFTASGSAFKNAELGQIREGLSATGRIGKMTQLAVDGGPTVPTDAAGAQAAVAGPGFVASGLKYTFDVKTSTVVMSLPLADIAKYGKAPVTGATLSAVFASAAADSATLSFPFDTVPDGGSATASKLTYNIGDNTCFAPPVPPLSSVGALKAQYGDVAAVAAKLVDATKAPVAGKTVTFTLGASKATGVTGADGVAKAALLVTEKAGSRTLTISAEGTTTTATFTVLLEKTVLKAVNNKGVVTATLTDDDKKPLSGQVVTFTIGSKKATARTDAKGVAKVTGFPAGNVKVTYAGTAGMYAATSATSKP